MTDFWQGQRPWFAFDGMNRPEHRSDEGESQPDAGQPRPPSSDDPHARREPADELMQRAIQRAYDR